MENRIYKPEELPTSNGRRVLDIDGAITGLTHMSFGLCPDCGHWQQLLDWNATHKLGCPGKAKSRPIAYCAKPRS